jgi:hypothetical protein
MFASVDITRTFLRFVLESFCKDEYFKTQSASEHQVVKNQEYPPMSSYHGSRMANSREDALERALDESKRSLAEVVDEVILCEKELAKYNQVCQRLQDRIQELEGNER